MEGFKELLIPALDYALRVAGAVSLVVIAAFLAWWFL